MNNYQQLEHQTGLIQAPLTDRSVTSIRTSTTTDATTDTSRSAKMTTKIKSPHTIKALQTLRDSNPSLLNKLTHKSKEIQQGTGVDIDIDDTCIEYWNSIQEMITLHDDDHSIKILNLGGLMVRIKTLIPFMSALMNDATTSKNRESNLEVLNLGGTDIPLSNLLEALTQTQTQTTATSCDSDNDEKKTNEHNDYDNSLCTSIQKLYISGCSIPFQRDGIQNLTSILEHCPNITTLDLRYNDLQKPSKNDHDMDVLKTLFRTQLVSSQSKIEILHLEGNNINDDIMDALSDGFSSSSSSPSSIKELYLGSNKIQSCGAKILANKLKGNQVLQKLYIECNFIGDDGVEEFCLLLEEGKQHNVNDSNNDSKSEFNIALEKLWVENNGAGKEMMERLGKALQSESTIGGF
jgi:hypothetical protein